MKIDAPSQSPWSGRRLKQASSTTLLHRLKALVRRYLASDEPAGGPERTPDRKSGRTPGRKSVRGGAQDAQDMQTEQRAGAQGYDILIAEDDPDLCRLFARVLQNAGFSVRVASNGNEVLRMLQPGAPAGTETAPTLEGAPAATPVGQPALILMDWWMPGIDGLACTRHIRQVLGLDRVIIIALTAHSMPGDKPRALSAGCDGYLNKPITGKKLVAEVTRRLRPEPA